LKELAFKNLQIFIVDVIICKLL